MNDKKVSIQVKGTPLIKFQSEDRIKCFREGHLYAKTLGYYRKLEEETGDEEIGDGYEAMIHVNEAIIRIPETGEEQVLNDELIKTSHSDDHVFCMFGIYPQLETFAFSEKQKEKMLSFGDTALIILDSDEFINRVIKTAERNGLKAYFNGVKYYDPSYDSANMIVDLMKGMWNVAFWKRKSYTYQQEARFVFVSDKPGEDHVILDIGDITDITEVVPARQVLNVTVEKEK